MAKPSLTQDQVLALFEYRDGDLYWKERPKSDFNDSDRYCRAWNKRCAGKKAGSEKLTYAVVGINGVNYLQHRIIYLMHHGHMPEFIDHIDTNKFNNKIENLRETNKSANNMNRYVQKNSSSGHKNVHWNKQHNKWMARVQIGRKQVFGGLFSNPKDAAIKADELRKLYHQEHARA